jgi:hypothetical protein
MSELAADLADNTATSGSSTRVHDAVCAFYQQLYRDPNLDVWLICWVDGQNTGTTIHDRLVWSGLRVRRTLYEDLVSSRGGRMGARADDQSTLPAAGSTSTHPTSTASVIPGPDAPPATSIHFYSPALWRMGHYEPGPAACAVSG